MHGANMGGMYYVIKGALALFVLASGYIYIYTCARLSCIYTQLSSPR